MENPASPPAPIPFEQALERLEAIVQDLEDGQGDLEEALSRYEEGVRLARHCLDRLHTAELRVRELALE